MPENDDPDDGPKDDDKPDPVDDDKSAQDDKDKPDDAPDLGDAGKKAIDAMKRERNAAKRELAEIRDKLKKYEDEGKSETQRLQEAAEEAKTRAGKAEAGLLRMQVALENAPEGATLAQIRAVAKRLAGESKEDMEADAEELFALVAPTRSEKDDGDKKPLPTKPREKLRGGGDPDDEPEVTDPRKLAALIGRQ